MVTAIKIIILVLTRIVNLIMRTKITLLVAFYLTKFLRNVITVDKLGHSPYVESVIYNAFFKFWRILTYPNLEKSKTRIMELLSFRAIFNFDYGHFRFSGPS